MRSISSCVSDVSVRRRRSRETAAPAEPAEAALNAGAPRPTLAPLGGLSRYNFVGPTRLFDTRTAGASTRLVRSDGTSGTLDAMRTGYLVPEGELRYQAVAPARLLDTRQATSLYNGRLGTDRSSRSPSSP